MTKNQKGFTAVEGLLIIVVVGLIGFVGWYVVKQQKSDKSASSNSVSSTKPIKPVQITPEQTLEQMGVVFKAKNKAKFNAYISDAMKADGKANGVPDVYDNFAGDQISASIFTNIDYGKLTPVIKDYKSKAGVKGRQLVYTVVTTDGSAKSTNIFTFDFIPKGNGWILDDMGLDSKSSAAVSGSVDTSQQ